MDKELSEALAKLGENIERNKRETKRLDYGDYRVFIIDQRGVRNIELEKDGDRSITEVKEDGTIGHTELFDINSKSVADLNKKTERETVVSKIIKDILGTQNDGEYFEEF